MSVEQPIPLLPLSLIICLNDFALFMLAVSISPHIYHRAFEPILIDTSLMFWAASTAALSIGAFLYTLAQAIAEYCHGHRRSRSLYPILYARLNSTSGLWLNALGTLLWQTWMALAYDEWDVIISSPKTVMAKHPLEISVKAFISIAAFQALLHAVYCGAILRFGKGKSDDLPRQQFGSANSGNPSTNLDRYVSGQAGHVLSPSLFIIQATATLSFGNNLIILAIALLALCKPQHRPLPGVMYLIEQKYIPTSFIFHAASVSTLSIVIFLWVFLTTTFYSDYTTYNLFPERLRLRLASQWAFRLNIVGCSIWAVDTAIAYHQWDTNRSYGRKPLASPSSIEDLVWTLIWLAAGKTLLCALWCAAIWRSRLLGALDNKR